MLATANMTELWSNVSLICGTLCSISHSGAYLLAVLPGDILLLFVPDYSMTMCPSVLSERQKVQFNYTKSTLHFYAI